MVAADSPSANRAASIEALMKSKGFQTLDDLEQEEQQLLELQNHHKLVVIVEFCHAVRPSKLGSLKGSHEKYEEEFARLEQTFGGIQGAGEIEVIKWEAGMPPLTSSSSRPPPKPRSSRPQSAGASRAASRPQSAAASSQPRGMVSLLDGNPQTPRIGSFEVFYKLVNTQSGQQYGPVEVFSKLLSGHWPGAPSILIKRVQEQLQPFLQRDMGAGMLFQHAQALAKEAKEVETRSRPILQQAEDLPDVEPSPAQPIAAAEPPAAEAAAG